ncbi:hypothetical protein Mgra_00002906 [Meloidogyne graminicola]|uniref:Uncharacterized protein n=1 Tax=Meloidogyne graminicola TaxID=189291 RepID=A0A8S9ZWN6_9BILA|nr:hypothetical protein Mgra_00002906 [Meloidogyne graminicola]
MLNIYKFFIYSIYSFPQNILLFLLFQFNNYILSFPHFSIKSVNSHSVVIEMADALNVNRFDMRVLIFDLDKLREFRKSELTGIPYNAQLFTFDGLTQGTWFAFRIEYRLVFSMILNGNKQIINDSKLEIPLKELSTKQELVVQTRTEINEENVEKEKLNLVEEISDELVKFENIQLFPQLHQLNITVLPSLKQNDMLNTLIVAELRCARGTIKPPAQQVPNKGTILSFDLKRIHPGMLNYWNALNRLKCVEFCVFPFIRVGHQTNFTNLKTSILVEEKRKYLPKYIFRARELCELIPEEIPKNELINFKENNNNEWINNNEQQRNQLELQLLERHFRSSNNSPKNIKIIKLIFLLIIYLIQKNILKLF